MIAFLKICWREYQKQAADNKAAQRLYRIALQFNRLHTYGKRREWMCPRCNSVHKSDGHSMLTGLEYPSCCGLPQGHRHGSGFALEDSP